MEAYEEGFDVIFNYGYGCYAFTHNICGSQPKVPDGMSIRLIIDGQKHYFCHRKRSGYGGQGIYFFNAVIGDVFELPS